MGGRARVWAMDGGWSKRMRRAGTLVMKGPRSRRQTDEPTHIPPTPPLPLFKDPDAARLITPTPPRSQPPKLPLPS